MTATATREPNAKVGSEFGFKLPEGPKMGQPRILIIEDERGLTQTLSWYFHREGFETIVTLLSFSVALALVCVVMVALGRAVRR